MRARWSAIAVAVTMLLAAAPAQASTAWGSGDTLYYVAAPGELNLATVLLQGRLATVQDGGYPPMGMVDPCTPWEYLGPRNTGAWCPADAVERLVVDLGDRSDTLTAGVVTMQRLPTLALGGAGNDDLLTGPADDDLTGGPGQDVVHAAGGNDLVDALDGEADTVDCGYGNDSAIVDGMDTVTNCETLLAERPAESPAPVIPTPPEPTVTSTWEPDPLAPVVPPVVEGSPLTPSPWTAPTAVAPEVRLRLSVSVVSLRTARTAGLPVRASCGAGCRVKAVVRVSPERARRLGVPRTLARGTKTGEASGTAALRMRLRGARLATVRVLRVTIHAEAVTATGQRLFQDVELTLRR